ncbi:hypothetical protein PFISCL1PPCAC_19953 [Pristionchus fissidentatus]|uniref:Dol-P-Glc:Glc(2)Man(9)GlcNAc(2)-PP-Dol alpha-1,2-glucosyltransferase n=1 Tax=Pristionchus fissidentatus TaxID=1538716 RepID=A0AAV5WCS3_9BILA|nr:hypothetical protein PFISCL1PPCAC_19953 [Pristionchus fissidentatus]
MICLKELLTDYGPASIFIGFVHYNLVSIVYNIVPDGYMDEIFHIGQTRRYCQGNYSWDPMITTPPGLYVLAIPLFCGRERYLNSLLYPLLFLAACRFRSRFTRSSLGLSSLSVICLPVLLHSSLLFYTDPLSLLLTLLSFSLPPLPSSFFFLLSLSVRQTNIGWAFLYASSVLISSISPSSIIRSSLSVLPTLSPFVLLAITFLSFLYINGGSIVLGDASAHKPVVHLSQPLLFVLFSSLHTWPHVLPLLPSIASHSIRPSSVILIFILPFTLYSFYYTHPYLLADNRHIPFYIHRIVLSNYFFRLLLSIPILISISFLSFISSSSPRYLRLLFLLSTSIILVPAHLIEFRYFITPFAIWRLSIPSPSIFSSLIELFSNLIIFSCVFSLFLFKPFEWPHEAGVLQRFMW